MSDARPPDSGPQPARTPDAALAASSPDPAVGRQARLFAWLFGGAGLGVLLCCGGGLAWANGVEKTDDPARVREIAAGLFAAEIPERFEPELALGVPPPPIVGWFRDGRTDVVDYATPGGGRLTLSRSAGGDADPAAAVAAAAADMTNADGARGEVRTLTTRAGRTYPVAFAATPAGATPRAGEPESADGPTAPAGPVRRVYGMFREGESTYSVQLALPEREYDEAEVTAFLESLGPAIE